MGVRYGKKSPFDYVRSGTDYCQVRFCFLRGGKKYEVVRRVRAKGKQSASEALLLVNDEVMASQRSLVDEKLREIMETSYESFISTFFLPQGMVANLLTSTRSKINEVIFDVLFEKKKLAKLIEKVNEAYKSVERDREEHLRKVNELKDEIEKLESYIKESPLEVLEREIKILEDEMLAKEEKLRDVEKDLQIHSQLESLEGALRSKLDERQKLLILLEEEKKISAAKSHEVLYREFLHACDSLTRVESNLGKLRMNHSKTQQEIQKIDGEIQSASLELQQCEKNVQSLQQEIERLSKIDELSEPLNEKLTKLRERKLMLQEMISNKNRDLEKSKKEIEQRKKEYAELERELAMLNEQFSAIKSSAILWMAEQIAEELQDGDVCPVCGGIYNKRTVNRFEYDVENYQQLRESIEEMKEKRSQLSSTLQNLSEAADKLEQELNSLRQQLRQIEEEEKKLSRELEELGYSSQIKRKLRELSAQLQKLLEKKSTLLADLSKKETTKQQLKMKLEELEKEIEEFVKEREQLSTQKQNVEKELFSVLNSIGMDFETFKKYVAKELPKVSTQESLTKTEAEISQLESQIQQLRKSLKWSKLECQSLAGSLRQELQDLKTQRDQKLNRKAVVQHFMERRGQLLEQLEKVQEKFEEARKLSSVLFKVRDTLTAREFQSYVANTVLNGVVERANRLLEYLTDGRFTLSVDESGFVVRDEGVKRDANGLSGGEKTLVSIALAMSIAEQATGEMEAFFIDEGFSSLDSNNKSKVADALRKLEKLNKVIGFVTHDPEFADYFERKLIVEKGGKLRWM